VAAAEQQVELTKFQVVLVDFLAVVAVVGLENLDLEEALQEQAHRAKAVTVDKVTLLIILAVVAEEVKAQLETLPRIYILELVALARTHTLPGRLQLVLD
jgi:hypothetical protein